MHRTSVRAAAILLAATGSASAQVDGAAMPAPPALLERFGVEAATLQDLTVPPAAGRPFEVRVRLAGHGRTIRLWPHDVRGPGFGLLVDDGSSIRRASAPPPVTYRGAVVGEPDAVVTGAVLDGRLEAVVGLGGATWGIEPASRAFAALPARSHLVYRHADVAADGRCGIAGGHVVLPPPVANAAGSATLKQAELALDLAHSFFVLHGSSTTSALNAALTTVNGIDAIFSRDVGVTFAVTRVIVRTSPVYTTNDPTQLLSQFRDRWNSRHGNVPRDWVYLFAGDPGAPLAALSFKVTVCSNLANAYGVQ